MQMRQILKANLTDPDAIADAMIRRQRGAGRGAQTAEELVAAHKTAEELVAARNGTSSSARAESERAGITQRRFYNVPFLLSNLCPPMST